MIGANKQAEAVLSAQMSKLLFDLGMTGGQLSRMTYEDPVSVLGMGAGSSAVGTMLSTSSSLLNAPGSRYLGTTGVYEHL